MKKRVIACQRIHWTVATLLAIFGTAISINPNFEFVRDIDESYAHMKFEICWKKIKFLYVKEFHHMESI